jgi:hypothetical protein
MGFPAFTAGPGDAREVTFVTARCRERRVRQMDDAPGNEAERDQHDGCEKRFDRVCLLQFLQY